MKALKIVILLFLGFVLIVASFFIGVGYGVFYTVAPVGGEKPVTIDIQKGASIQEIGSHLEQAGVIRSAFLFKTAMNLTKSDKEIMPGKYVVSPSKNLMEIITQLRSGQGALRLVTIPEGLKLVEIAELMEKNNVIKANKFLTTAKEEKFSINGQVVRDLEGYLFPETYDIPANYSSADVIQVMVRTFNERVVPVYLQKKDTIPVKLSLHQVITLASLVEREAQVPSERPIIASVYYNRLNRSMPLQCDATVQYVLGKQKKVLTRTCSASRK